MATMSLNRIIFDGHGGAKTAERWNVGHRIRDVEQGPDGSLWMLEDANPGALIHVTPHSDQFALGKREEEGRRGDRDELRRSASDGFSIAAPRFDRACHRCCFSSLSTSSSTCRLMASLVGPYPRSSGTSSQLPALPDALALVGRRRPYFCVRHARQRSARYYGRL